MYERHGVLEYHSGRSTSANGPLQYEEYEIDLFEPLLDATCAFPRHMGKYHYHITYLLYCNSPYWRVATQ